MIKKQNKTPHTKNKCKRQTMDWGKYVQLRIDKGLISTRHEDHLQNC